MSDLRELYQEVILDHNKSPCNFHKLEGANRMAEGFNPLCGDRFTVYLHMEGDVIQDISFLGAGCAICCKTCSTCSCETAVWPTIRLLSKPSCRSPGGIERLAGARLLIESL